MHFQCHLSSNFFMRARKFNNLFWLTLNNFIPLWKTQQHLRFNFSHSTRLIYLYIIMTSAQTERCITLNCRVTFIHVNRITMYWYVWDNGRIYGQTNGQTTGQQRKKHDRLLRRIINGTLTHLNSGNIPGQLRKK